MSKRYTLWQVTSDLGDALGLLERVLNAAGSSGAEKVAAEASKTIRQAAEHAFSAKVDPRTGEPWAPPAERTTEEKDSPRGRVGFRSLLVRSGELQSDIRTGFGVVPMGAVAFGSFDRRTAMLASIMYFGVVARKYRNDRGSRGPEDPAGHVGRKRKGVGRARKRPGATMPPRRLLGISDAELDHLTEYYRELLVAAGATA